MSLALPEVLNLLLVGLEDETDLSGGQKPKAPAEIPETAGNGPEVSMAGSGMIAPPAQFTLSASAHDQTEQLMTAPGAGTLQ